MEAMRLGTLPIVAPTGGLKDTVEAGGKVGEMASETRKIVVDPVSLTKTWC
jgi:glycogen synthase